MVLTPFPVFEIVDPLPNLPPRGKEQEPFLPKEKGKFQ
jgi:hypothetical protein